MATYSFLDVMAALIGPGAAISLGRGSASGKEGITIARSEDKNTMQVGADGAVMHSLHAGKPGTMTIRLLKTSPANALLSAAYAFQTTSSANHGQNVITVSDVARGDVITGRDMAFKKFPDVNYAEEGGMQEWVFEGRIDGLLGTGSPSA